MDTSIPPAQYCPSLSFHHSPLPSFPPFFPGNFPASSAVPTDPLSIPNLQSGQGKRGKDNFKSSYTDDGSEKLYNEHRTSKFIHLSKAQDRVARAIEQRASDMIGAQTDNVEPIQIVTYTEGQRFDLHHDAGSLDVETGKVEIVPPRRIATFFVYLNTLPLGIGHTAFPYIKGVLSSPALPTLITFFCPVLSISPFQCTFFVHFERCTRSLHSSPLSPLSPPLSPLPSPLTVSTLLPAPSFLLPPPRAQQRGVVGIYPSSQRQAGLSSSAISMRQAKQTLRHATRPAPSLAHTESGG